MFALVLFSLCAILLVPRPGNSHDPITTKVLFNKEIVRIFQQHCLACHNSQSISNISLTTYAEARPWAKAFKEEVLEKRMPPAQAVKGFGHFLNDKTLTKREIDQIVSWVDGGVPKGDDKDLPTDSALKDWQLGKPNLTLEPRSEIDLGAGEGDEYRCLTLPVSQTGDRWVTAFDFQPGNGSSVHCAWFGIGQTHKPIKRRLDSAHAVDCGSQELTAATTLGTWMPGQAVTRLPRDVARFLPAGSTIFMKVHYHKGAEPVSVKSTLALYFTKDLKVRRLRTVALKAPASEVAAGQSRLRLRASYVLPETAEAIAIRPLLFPFVRSLEVTAYKPDGTTEVLIWARDYRYDWQPDYTFREPVELPQRTRIVATAYLDNSDDNPVNPSKPAQAVRFEETLCELSLVGAKKAVRAR